MLEFALLAKSLRMLTAVIVLDTTEQGSVESLFSDQGATETRGRVLASLDGACLNTIRIVFEVDRTVGFHRPGCAMAGMGKAVFAW